MPYRRQYIKGNRRNVRRKRPVKSIKARQSYYRMQFPEKKYLDSRMQVNSIGYSDACTWVSPNWTGPGSTDPLLFAPAQGNAMYERTGRRVWISDIKMNFEIDWCIAGLTESSFTTDMIDSVTVILVLDTQIDKQAWGASGPATVMASDMGNSVTINARSRHLMFTNTNEWGRYKVLKSKTFYRPTIDFSGPGTNTAYQSGAVRAKKFKHKFIKPLQVNFKESTTGGETDVVDNGLRFIYIASNDSGINPSGLEKCPDIGGVARIGFYDHK